MISVKVPATSANLGPGFDCLGMALNIYNTIEIHDDVDRLIIEDSGLRDQIEKNEDNLIYKSFKRLYDDVGKKVPPVRIAQHVDIPLSRGLGSSAACIIGGLTAANEMLGKPVDKKRILELATEMEGHPDNVAPALLGGLVVSITSGEGVRYIQHPIDGRIDFLALIPDFTLSTKKARSVLPSTISHKDAVFNVGRASLLTASLITGNLDNIGYAVEDKLHQPYRLSLINDGEKIFHAAGGMGIAALFISGSGSTLLAIPKGMDAAGRIKDFCSNLSNKWDIRLLKADNEGVGYKKVDNKNRRGIPLLFFIYNVKSFPVSLL